MKKKLRFILVFLLIAVGIFATVWQKCRQPNSISLENIPAFSGDPFVVLQDNQPNFTQKDMTVTAYEFYSELDFLGRCGYAMACIGRELMPTEDRESISSVKPSGWVQAQYDIVDGNNLYNRCHLIGFQLTGENANEKNLITGTRYLNVEGMLPFENMVADYIKETGNHVLYRVTPIFDTGCLVASGVQMEAKSVEDEGKGICFHVYVYNNQPGVIIDYRTGNSSVSDETESSASAQTNHTYILNTATKKFHKIDCRQSQDIKAENKTKSTLDRSKLIQEGYIPAGCCNP